MCKICYRFVFSNIKVKSFLLASLKSLQSVFLRFALSVKAYGFCPREKSCSFSHDVDDVLDREWRVKETKRLKRKRKRHNSGEFRSWKKNSTFQILSPKRRFKSQAVNSCLRGWVCKNVRLNVNQDTKSALELNGSSPYA